MNDTSEYPDIDALDDTLEHYFDKYGNDDSILSVGELDGFFAALACAPQAVMPSRWLPAVWGGETQMPDWDEKEEIEEFHEALMLAYNQVMEEFVEGDYSPRIYGDDDAFVAVDEWCEGFLRGVRLFGPLAEADQAFLQQQLQPIRLFITDEGIDELLTLTPEQVNEQAAKIEPNVLALRKYFFDRQVIAAHTPFMTTEPKAGRNDPCPCGSGKKFKKCCLH